MVAFSERLPGGPRRIARRDTGKRAACATPPAGGAGESLFDAIITSTGALVAPRGMDSECAPPAGGEIDLTHS